MNMKKYSPIVYSIAIPKLNCITNTIRALKKGEPWGKDIFEKYGSNESDVIFFLDWIKEKHNDVISNPTTFNALIANKELTRKSLGKVYREYSSLDDLSNFTLKDFTELPFAMNSRRRILDCMIKHNVPLKDKTVAEMDEFLKMVDAF